MSQICSLPGKGGVKVSVVVADTELKMEEKNFLIFRSAPYAGLFMITSGSHLYSKQQGRRNRQKPDHQLANDVTVKIYNRGWYVYSVAIE